MAEEELRAIKEVNYEKAKKICRRYYENEIVYAHTFLEEISTLFVDTRHRELHLLIEELKKIENRINEINNKYKERKDQ